MTLADLLRSSFRLIGVLREGQGPNADDIYDGLFVLNSMLEAWSIERLNVFTIQPQTYRLAASQQSYTIGPGGVFDAPRPLRIERANVLIDGDVGEFELPLEVLTVEQWAAITLKSTTSTIPTRVYYDLQFPLGNLNFWPVPAVSIKVILYTWQAIQTGFTDVDVDLSFPPGYAEAIRYNLACRLAPEWGKKCPPEVVTYAREAKAAIKRMNKPTYYLGCDVAIAPVPAGVWNWLTGSSDGR